MTRFSPLAVLITVIVGFLGLVALLLTLTSANPHPCTDRAGYVVDCRNNGGR